MSYERIQIPRIDFMRMPQEALKEYCAWYLATAKDRIPMLEEIVHREPGLAAWKPDLSPDSLISLGCWLRNHSFTVLGLENVTHQLGRIRRRSARVASTSPPRSLPLSCCARCGRTGVLVDGV